MHSTSNINFLLECRRTAEIVEELREEAVQIGVEVDRQVEALEDCNRTINKADKELEKATKELRQHS